MKCCWFLLLLASLALYACVPGPAPAAATPTAGLATVSAVLPTTLAAFQLSSAATPSPSPTPRSLAAYPGPAGTQSFTPLPPAPIIGRHVVQPGDTIFCIGRAYGVLPAAIAQANGLSGTVSLAAGQVLQIPEVQWTDIPDGLVCAAQFQSPFPGLARPTPTFAASLAPSGAPLVVSLNFICIQNCGSKDGSYVIHVEVSASGGLPPYAYTPAEAFDVTVPHCTNGLGTATVTSADGQTAQQSWTYFDVACH